MGEHEIISIHGREVLDSRGNPTVEVDVVLESGAMGRASVPSGASTGSHEAIELRDGDKGRYLGKGVTKAVDAINGEIADAVTGFDALDQTGLDMAMIELDGTENKARLGANAILAVSLATARAGAASVGLPLYRYLGGVGARVLPMPMMNIINGGAHADNSLDIQEFMILPVGAASFSEALRMGTEVFHALKKLLKDAGHNTSVGDEGGFAPNLAVPRRRWPSSRRAIGAAGYKLGEDVVLGARRRLQRVLQGRPVRPRGRGQDARPGRHGRAGSQGLCEKFPIVSVEDGMAEDDWDGWKLLTERLGRRRCSWSATTCSSPTPTILARGIEEGVANSILIKVNQIGTLTETLDAIQLAHRAPATRRSSRTAPARPRIRPSPTSPWPPIAGRSRPVRCRAPTALAKYNQLLRIEQMLGDGAVYAGRSGLARG